MKKRVLSLLLSILLVLSLVPVSALAEGDDPGEPDPAPMSDPAADPAPEVDGVENDLTDPAPQDEEDVLMGDPQTASDGEDITPDPDEMNEEDNTQEVPLPAVNEENAPSDDLTPATESVQVVFTCDPTDLVLTVWAKPEADEEPAPNLPEEDGAYLLLPGEYLYTAEAEGYAPAEEVPFTVAASEELLQIDIVLITEQIEVDSDDALNDPEDEPECIGPAIVLDNSEDETDSEDSQTGSDETEGKFVSDALESDQSDLDGEPQILSASKNEMLADAELEYCYMDREESNADLFAKYVDRMFRNLGKEQTRHMPTPDARLSEAGFAVEQALKSMIMEVAEGTRTDTYFEVDLAELGYDPSSITQDDIDVLPSILIFDCSYELYWFGCAWTIPMIYSGNLYFGFVVGMPFRPEESEEFSVDTAAITRANTAVANAQAIIDRYAACSDYDKLHGYKNEICKLNVYNYDAANASNDDPWYACETDNNPWALVNVFDNDPETNVVCEGYSEAFEYLCNQSVFRSSLTNAYCVTGINHKWNNVTMDDGKNYMVDVTWCDDENSENGNDDWFLRPWCGADGVAPSFDSFHIKINTSYGGWYLSERSYDDETKASYSDAALTLSDTEYVPGAYVSVTGVTVTPTTASVAVGGTQQLTAVVAPENATNPTVTWSSSDETIATVDGNGLVTAVAAGTATITAAAGDQTAACEVTVTEPEPEYDAFIGTLGGSFGDIQIIRYTFLVKNTFENPTFALTVGGASRPQVEDELHFKGSDWACWWLYSGPTASTTYEGYTQYVIWVKLFAKQYNTKTAFTITSDGELLKIKSFERLANGIHGTVDTSVSYSMVDLAGLYAILRPNGEAWAALKVAIADFADKLNVVADTGN